MTIGTELEKITSILFVNQVHRILETWRRQVRQAWWLLKKCNAWLCEVWILDSVKVVGYDESVAITERNGEVIQQLEELSQKMLRWLVCLLHANELPLRDLFLHLDGTTAGL